MNAPVIVGAFDAKTRLSELLGRVERGEIVTITRRGRPIARLVPIEAGAQDRAAEAITRLRALRRSTTLGGLDWRELRDAGRR
ncbi:MAG TPA: type II toxin-antitoxin system prevent-host-death family antitoxin [Acetobacteraceae bacterium]|nr:type II toxin-antitoxin system prevent-host-death family antitoxin [Acetobacteraceae bacterium]